MSNGKWNFKKNVLYRGCIVGTHRKCRRDNACVVSTIYGRL